MEGTDRKPVPVLGQEAGRLVGKRIVQVHEVEVAVLEQDTQRRPLTD